MPVLPQPRSARGVPPRRGRGEHVRLLAPTPLRAGSGTASPGTGRGRSEIEPGRRGSERDVARLGRSCGIAQARTRGEGWSEGSSRAKGSAPDGASPSSSHAAPFPAARSQVAATRRPSWPGAPAAKPSERGRGFAEAVGAPGIWTYLCNDLQNRPTEVTAPRRPRVQTSQRPCAIQEYIRICKLILYYRGSIHAMLIMHTYKFKLALCYCESTHVALITHIYKSNWFCIVVNQYMYC